MLNEELCQLNFLNFPEKFSRRFTSRAVKDENYNKTILTFKISSRKVIKKLPHVIFKPISMLLFHKSFSIMFPVQLCEIEVAFYV